MKQFTVVMLSLNKVLKSHLQLGSIFILSSVLFACDQNAQQGSFGSKIEDYHEARKVFWRDLYPKTATSLYCGDRVDSRHRSGYNIEHVFPMSWVSNGLKCGKRKQCRQSSPMFNKIEADLHNLFPAKSKINQERSSYRFAEIPGEKRKFGSCDFEVDYYRRSVEPREEVRGDIARAMFYMADRYKDQGLVIFKRQAKLLIEWHRKDPPNQAELERNERIKLLQGWSNPFIDSPELLNTVYKQGNFDS